MKLNTITTSASSRDKFLFLLPAVWLLVNLVQSACTGLANDEAYYWMYAKNLDWGYFDHPPMIALLIKAGGFLFHGEIGVRVFISVLSAASLVLLHRLSEKKDFLLLFWLFAATTVFEVYGFVAVPDAPLIFFTIVFFLAYKRYLHDEGLMAVVGMALAVALLLYSKYHGLLVIFFTLISNLKLLRRKSFYAIVFLAIVLYLPHLIWQVANDYPSYQYHVLNKSQTPYNPLDSLKFIAGTLGVYGPLTVFLLMYAAWKFRRVDPLLRAYRFTLIGFFVFFFFSTFNAAVEPNWMAAAAVPLLLLGHDAIAERPKLRALAVRLSVAMLVICCFFRINLMFDLVPVLGHKAMPEFYNAKKWAQEIDQRSKGAPVVIINSYQRASQFSFYAGRDALSLNSTDYRRNQYDLWNIVDQLQGKRVFLVPNWEMHGDSIVNFETAKGKECGMFINDFHAYTKVAVDAGVNRMHFDADKDVEIPLTVHNPHYIFEDSRDYPVNLEYTLYYYDKLYERKMIEPLSSTSNGEVLRKDFPVTLHLHTPSKPGPYYIRFSISTGWIPPAINSRLIRVDVE